MLLAILPAEFKGRAPYGDLKEGSPVEASVGEVLAVEEPDRGKPAADCGRWVRLGCSDLLFDIIDYSVCKTLSILHER